MATVTGGSGDDTLNGTSAADTIVGGDGADSVTAGAGDDSILGNDGLGSADGGDIIDAGDGADTVQGDGGDDIIRGGTGADSLHGDSGNDWIDGGADNDLLYGDTGADTVLGGDGNDTIYGGDGDDVIRGGAGDDTIYGHADADTFIISDNSGSDSIEDYSAGDGDILLVDYPGITNYSELEPYLSDDGNWGTLVSLPDGSVTQIKWLNYATQSASDFSFQSGTVCFLKGTMIETSTGWRRVETLQQGDLVVTFDNGLQPLRYISQRTYRFRDGPYKMKPIRIRPHTFGPDRPSKELLVSPQHRIGLPQCAPDHIIAAKKLLGMAGVSERPSCRLARYCHLLLDRHELVRANGVWAETLLVTDYSTAHAHIPIALRDVQMVPVRRITKSFEMPVPSVAFA